MTTVALPRQPHSWLSRLRTIHLGIGARGAVGVGLARQRGGAAATSWWLSGGVAAGNAVAVYQPKGAASLAASYSNLANPGTYDAAPGIAPTWDQANGWTFNGSTQYLATGYAAGTGTTRSLIVRFSNATTSGNRCIAGAADASAAFDVTAAWFGYRYAMDNGGYYLASTGAGVASGVHAVAGTACYVAGLSVGTVSAASGNVNVPTMYIGCRNANGSPNYYYAGYIQALAIYNTALIAPQVAAISAAMAAL